MLLLTLAMLAVVAGLLVTATSPKRAAASCTGAGQPFLISRYDANGTLVASEGPPYPGSTCDGDATYQGLVLDAVTDGSCAYAYYLEPVVYYAQQGVSCTTGAWSAYSYTDAIGPNSVFVSVRPSYLPDVWWLSSGY
jgi:hypothetical protein